MRSNAHPSTYLALVATLVIACADQRDLGPAEGAPALAEVGLAIELGPGVLVSELRYRITHNGTTIIEGEAAAEERAVIRLALPAGTSYLVELDAVASNGVRCRGSAAFAVTARGSSMVRVPMSCDSERGEVTIAPNFSGCRLITAVVAAERPGDPGAFELSVSTAPSPAWLSYHWTAVGVIGNPGSPHTSFLCPAPDAGRVIVNVAVSDGSCRDQGSVTVECRPDGPPGCAACLATNCPPDIAGCQGLSGQDRVDCLGLLACTERTGCVAAGDGMPCYCGTADIGRCLNGAGNGACRIEMEVAGKTVNPLLIGERVADPSYPLGLVMNLYGCRALFCERECGP